MDSDKEKDIFVSLLEAVWKETREPEYAARYAELDLAHVRGEINALKEIGDLFTREDRERTEQAGRVGAIFPALLHDGDDVTELAWLALAQTGIAAMSPSERSLYDERLQRAREEIERLHAVMRRNREIA